MSQIDTTTGEITEEPRGAFDPSRHLRKLDKGGNYLDVKWRIKWLRTEHPDALMTTEVVQLDWEQGYIVIHAHIVIPDGGTADGIGSETRHDFPTGWVEKAETVAVGRALAALGFGTQFCGDFETLDEAGNGHVADSPVEGGYRGNPSASSLATPAQLKLIYLTATKDLGITEDHLEAECEAQYGRQPLHLTKREASELIEALKARAAGGKTPSPKGSTGHAGAGEPPKGETPEQWAIDWIKRVASLDYSPIAPEKRKGAIEAMGAHLVAGGIDQSKIRRLCGTLQQWANPAVLVTSENVWELIDSSLIWALTEANSGELLMLRKLVPDK